MCRLPRCAPAMVFVLTFAVCSAQERVPSAAPAPDVAAPTPRPAGSPAPHPILNLAPRPRSRPAPTPAARPRLISPETAARLTSVAPKFDPRSANAEAAAALPLDEGVLSLDRYIVEGERPPNLKERELMTPETKVKLGYKRYAGLKIGSLPFLNNDAFAREMVEEDLALERRRELNDLGSLLPKNAKPRGENPPKSWAETGGSYAERKR